VRKGAQSRAGGGSCGAAESIQGRARTRRLSSYIFDTFRTDVSAPVKPSKSIRQRRGLAAQPLELRTETFPNCDLSCTRNGSRLTRHGRNTSESRAEPANHSTDRAVRWVLERSGTPHLDSVTSTLHNRTHATCGPPHGPSHRLTTPTLHTLTSYVVVDDDVVVYAYLTTQVHRLSHRRSAVSGATMARTTGVRPETKPLPRESKSKHKQRSQQDPHAPPTHCVRNLRT
jgi:hypothetical protein